MITPGGRRRLAASITDSPSMREQNRFDPSGLKIRDRVAEKKALG